MKFLDTPGLLAEEKTQYLPAYLQKNMTPWVELPGENLKNTIDFRPKISRSLANLPIIQHDGDVTSKHDGSDNC